MNRSEGAADSKRSNYWFNLLKFNVKRVYIDFRLLKLDLKIDEVQFVVCCKLGSRLELHQNRRTW